MTHATSGSSLPLQKKECPPEYVFSKHCSGKALWSPTRQEHFPEWIQCVRLPLREPGEMAEKSLFRATLATLSSLNQSRQAQMETRVSHSQPLNWLQNGGKEETHLVRPICTPNKPVFWLGVWTRLSCSNNEGMGKLRPEFKCWLYHFCKLFGL